MCKVGTGPTFPLQCFSALFPIDGWSPVCHLLALVILSEYCLSRKVEKWRELEGFSIQSRQKHVLEDHGRHMDKGNGSDIAGINSYWDTFSPNRWMIPPIGSVHLLTWGGGFIEDILSIKPLPMQWEKKTTIIFTHTTVVWCWIENWNWEIDKLVTWWLSWLNMEMVFSLVALPTSTCWPGNAHTISTLAKKDLLKRGGEINAAISSYCICGHILWYLHHIIYLVFV